MKRIIFIATLLLMAVAFNSCEEDKFGFDNKVIFSARGGEENVDGDYNIYTLSIGDYNGKEMHATDDEIMSVTFDWLTATARKHSNEIVLTAQPNNTGKRRKLYLYGAVNNRSIDITVIQNK